MTKTSFESLDVIVRNEAEAPKGKGIYYRCGECGELVHSQPDDNVGCTCGNIFIDIDYFRLVVRNFDLFEVVKKRRRGK